MIIILSGYNKDLNYQQELLKKIIMSNDMLNEVITKVHLLELDQYYIGAGSIVQTIWNYLSSYPLDKGINDIDVVYFNKIDSSYEEENEVIEKAKQLFKDVPIQLDIKNQARVHLCTRR